MEAAPSRPVAAGLARLPGRLTAELILRSAQYMSCIGLYEIDLRGNKIAAIENLGATENQFDSIDLSDNNIVKLEGFPKLNRIRQLLLSNNRIVRISRGLEEHIPNLETLVLSNNRLANLQDLDPLSTLPKLSLLSLMGCPVSLKPNYRLYIISKCKHLKVLDFKKVKLKEREEAQRMFPDEAAATAEAQRTFEPAEDFAAVTGQQAAAAEQRTEEAGTSAKPKTGMAPEDIVKLKAAIANAATIEEIQRLEAALKAGHLPSEVVGDGEGATNGKPSEMEVG